MNKLTIIGNLTKDPELRTTQSGINVCSFTVAVNRRRRDGQEPEADYFRVTAWRQLADICSKFLQKGKKVAVTGPVSVSTFTGSDGTTRASLDVTADDIEFLSPRVSDLPPEVPEEKKDPQTNWTQVPMDTDELPF
jgi:single-strand DNA-binding protein